MIVLKVILYIIEDLENIIYVLNSRNMGWHYMIWSYAVVCDFWCIIDRILLLFVVVLGILLGLQVFLGGDIYYLIYVFI